MFNKLEVKQTKGKDKLIKYAECPLISKHIFISVKKKANCGRNHTIVFNTPSEK